ncbi:MAG: hypothetical protein JO249_00445, partial [Acidobacteria bacterium]|nr:hypothetical protein [Acidobacteriota bacterium]
MMENNYIQLLTLVGFSYQYEWLRTSNCKSLWGSAGLGLNLLTRLTTGLDVLAVALFLFFSTTALDHPQLSVETPFRVGFSGALLAPAKSIFLFDPLLVLTLL